MVQVGPLSASAPRSRGLLRSRQPSSSWWSVGPALAGVAPSGTRARGRGSSRPRARGGCSPDAVQAAGDSASAPRSRGLLRPARAREPRRRVGPALAGVAPVTARRRTFTIGRPRARGGCSADRAAARAARGSAPRSRGLLRPVARPLRPHRVGPALAGVAPGSLSRYPAASSRPRARGGCSKIKVQDDAVPLSAPRSRGLLQLRTAENELASVGPALAGVARRSATRSAAATSRPRARGGCSPDGSKETAGQASAPRSRGLLRRQRQRDRERPVGPALAGVAPGRGPSPSARRCRPRARGGCSEGYMCTGCHTLSAPRSRGLLPHPTGGRAAAHVGPALAGVARDGGTLRRRRARRPRARGGCSLLMHCWAVRSPSAPRSRGLLPHHPRHRQAPAVGPALAGVAPRSLTKRAERGGRPRARGGCSGLPEAYQGRALSAPRSRGLL